ncbi:MAG: response regulator [Myxococcota bacterium]
MEGRRGREVAESYEGTIDALVTDIVMPGGGGGELVAALRRTWPGLPVVLMSGYADEGVLAGLPAGPEVVFLRKVFTPEELLMSLRRALDGRGEG